MKATVKGRDMFCGSGFHSRRLSGLWSYNIFVVLLAMAAFLFIDAQWKNLGLSSYTAGLISLAVVVVVSSFFILSLIFLLFIPDFESGKSDDDPSKAD